MAQKFPDRSVCITTKSEMDESNTKFAQGGIASVTDLSGDSYQKHISDTLTAGDGHCDPSIVEMVVTKGPERLRELMSWGTHFDKDKNGRLALGREGGHSEHRILHHKDSTGHEIERALLNQVCQRPNITVFQHHFAIDLITEHQIHGSKQSIPTCYGAYILDRKTGTVKTFCAKNTVLATGGAGTVYGHTTNPAIATGDGIAMASRAGAQVLDMEFVQFHPTVFYDGKAGQSFLISEAVRGFGAYLRNKRGHRFMPDHDKRAELAPRDIVSRSIDLELKKYGDPCVFLDCTHLDPKEFKTHFPNIYEECRSRHVHIEKDWIPIVPAAHYLCGGVAVDRHGRTTIKNLFACGECSRTGLHGANRLASNSLLEALVFAENIFGYLEHQNRIPKSVVVPKWDDKETHFTHKKTIIKNNRDRLQALMQDDVGIVRNTDHLRKAIKQLDTIHKEIEELYRLTKVDVNLCELRNMINVAHLIIAQCLKRKENKGGFYNIDFEPERQIVENITFIDHSLYSNNAVDGPKVDTNANDIPKKSGNKQIYIKDTSDNHIKYTL